MFNLKRRLGCGALAVCMLVAILVTPTLAWTDKADSLYSEFGAENDLTTAQLQNMEEIYNYLTQKLGLNTAAAAGVLANMYRESHFDPTAVGSKSLGICQWYGTNCTLLKEWCSENGYTATTLKGQLAYLTYQLTDSSNESYSYYNKIYQYLKSVSNSAQGAYDAAYYFCYYFEAPSNKATTSDSRGVLAKNKIYPFLISVIQANSSDSSVAEETVEETEEVATQQTETAATTADVTTESTTTGTETTATTTEKSSASTTTTSSAKSTASTTTTSSAKTTTATTEKSSTSTAATTEKTATTAAGNSSLPYEDVEAENPYYDAICQACETGLVTGTSDTTFEPDEVITRAQVVQALHILSGQPQVETETPFSDISDQDDYYESVVWAWSLGVISGVEDNAFEPDGSLTREEVAEILYNYCVIYLGQSEGTTGDLSGFVDNEDLTFGVIAMGWAVGCGVVEGIADADGSVSLDPNTACTRAQGTAMLVGLMNMIE